MTSWRHLWASEERRYDKERHHGKMILRSRRNEMNGYSGPTELTECVVGKLFGVKDVPPIYYG